MSEKPIGWWRGLVCSNQIPPCASIYCQQFTALLPPHPEQLQSGCRARGAAQRLIQWECTLTTKRIDAQLPALTRALHIEWEGRKQRNKSVFLWVGGIGMEEEERGEFKLEKEWRTLDSSRSQQRRRQQLGDASSFSFPSSIHPLLFFSAVSAWRRRKHSPRVCRRLEIQSSEDGMGDKSTGAKAARVSRSLQQQQQQQIMSFTNLFAVWACCS